MALSFDAVKKAYEVMNELELSNIQSFPPDWEDDIDEHNKKYPELEFTYGYDQKQDNGWENLFFFKINPSKEFIEKWNILKEKVRNTSFMKKHELNEDYTVFGWF